MLRLKTFCPGCGQEITVGVDGHTECGGEGEGLCTMAAFADDIVGGMDPEEALARYRDTESACHGVSPDQVPAPSPTVANAIDLVHTAALFAAQN